MVLPWGYHASSTGNPRKADGTSMGPHTQDFSMVLHHDSMVCVHDDFMWGFHGLPQDLNGRTALAGPEFYLGVYHVGPWGSYKTPMELP